MPSIAGNLAGRLDTALELLGKLLGVVQLQANSVLPLLRAAGQVLTADGLHILQIKSLGVTGPSHLSRIPLTAAPGAIWLLPRAFHA